MRLAPPRLNCPPATVAPIRHRARHKRGESWCTVVQMHVGTEATPKICWNEYSCFITFVLHYDGTGKGRKSTSRKKVSPKEQKHSFVRWFHHPIIQVFHHLARQPSSITPLRLTRPLEGAARNGTSSESTQPPNSKFWDIVYGET